MQNKTLSTAPPSWCDWTRQKQHQAPEEAMPLKNLPIALQNAMQTDENRLGSLLESGRIVQSQN